MKLGLNVLGERGLHELGGAERVAVYGVAILAEGVHALAVTDDLLQKLFGDIGLVEGDRGVAEAVVRYCRG